MQDLSAPPIKVGSFPYAPGFNPYQSLLTTALEQVGVEVLRIPPRKSFPLSFACHQPIDVLHLDWHYDWYRGKNWVTRILKRVMYRQGLRHFRRLPVVWTAHNLAAHDAKSGRTSIANYDHQMTQALLERCRGIMVLSSASEDLLRQRYVLPQSLRVVKVFHGHYIDAYPNAVSRQESREKLGFPQDATVLLSVGSLRPYKGHADLIRAFARVSEPNDHLLIGGKPLDEPYVNFLTSLIQKQDPDIRDRIHLHVKEIAGHELQYYFGAADMAVLPFSDILNSGSLLLALSFGIPVVAPSIGSIPEIAIQEYHQGYMPDESDGLEQAIVNAKRRFCHSKAGEIMTCQSHRSRAQNIIDQTRKRYSWQTSALNLSAFYRELLSDRA